MGGRIIRISGDGFLLLGCLDGWDGKRFFWEEFFLDGCERCGVMKLMKGFWIRSWHGIAWEFWRKSWGFSLVEYITVFRFLGGKEIEGTPRLEERLYDHRMG